MPNTEAESVDDMVEASRSEGSRAKCMFVHGMPESQKINMPESSAVSSTPAVASISPGAITGFMALMLVDMPPEKSMMHRAIMPTNCAVCISLKRMPRPSVPNSMPTIRNTSSKGSPVR